SLMQTTFWPLIMTWRSWENGGGGRAGARWGVGTVGSIDAAFVAVDEVGHADDLADAIGAAHVGQRLGEDFAAGVGYAFLHQLAVPFLGLHVGGQQGAQSRLDRVVVGRLEDDFFHRGRIDAEVQAEETVEAALVVFRVALGQRSVRLHVGALGEEARQIQQAGGRVRPVGRRQAGEHFAGGAGDGFGRHGATAPQSGALGNAILHRVARTPGGLAPWGLPVWLQAMWQRFLTPLGCSFIMLLGGPAARAATDAGRLYAQLCASCHGDKLEGGSGSSLVDGVWRHGADDLALARIISRGSPDDGMPGFGAVLDDAAVRGLVIYIREAAQRAANAQAKI